MFFSNHVSYFKNNVFALSQADVYVCVIKYYMHYVSVMKIRKIRELQLTNVRTLLIQVRLGPNV